MGRISVARQLSAGMHLSSWLRATPTGIPRAGVSHADYPPGAGVWGMSSSVRRLRRPWITSRLALPDRPAGRASRLLAGRTDRNPRGRSFAQPSDSPTASAAARSDAGAGPRNPRQRPIRPGPTRTRTRTPDATPTPTARPTVAPTLNRPLLHRRADATPPDVHPAPTSPTVVTFIPARPRPTSRSHRRAGAVDVDVIPVLRIHAVSGERCPR